jgi:hypothetical protein
MTTGIVGRNKLQWSEAGGVHVLHLGKRTTTLLHVVPDKSYPSVWRIRFPDGSLSDMANLTRAKDAALYIAVATLNRERRGQQSIAGRSPVDLNDAGATGVALAA